MQRSTEELLDALLAGIERELPRAVELRHRLHEHPELAHEEARTSAAIAAELPLAGETVAGTGRIVRVGPAGAPVVAVRAELDGVPVKESTGAPFSAAGNAMHACGHDVHMAALVALLRSAHELGGALPASVMGVFQPSEEAYPSGAEELARNELAAAAPAAIVAAHIHPELPWGTVALDQGSVNASCDYAQITVSGEPSHGAYPHLGRDPILAISQVVVALHAEAPRRIDPMHPAVLSVGEIAGGEAGNVIPAKARALAALRAHRPEDRVALRRLVEEVASGVAAAHGCSAVVELVPGEPALQNDPAIVSRARAMLARAGLEAAPEWRSCGSDDFAFFGALAPVAMAFVGLRGADRFEVRPLHHPELLPPDDAVRAVARVQAVLFVAAAIAEHA
ncbi:MAG TPA: M20 family metallopeptidase [Solirubrobacteraceae bacterium]|jgi:amidohydrolase